MGKQDKKIRIQYAALPYRMGPRGLEVALVTSRETKRWILPKGQPEKKLKGYEVAKQEAYEEAGLLGVVQKNSHAAYASSKRLKSGKEVPCDVKVYLLLIDQELAEWPEMHQRQRQWLPIRDAANVVSEPPLSALLRDFASSFV